MTSYSHRGAICCNRPFGPPPAGHFGRGLFWPAIPMSIQREGPHEQSRYGYRGTIVGEASHPGPPLVLNTDVDMNETFYDILEEIFDGEPVGPDVAMPIPDGHAVAATPIYVDPSPILLANENTDNLNFVDDKPFSGPDGLHTDVFLRKLLSRLECFPDVMPLTTVTFLPKSLTRRYGKLATTVLDW